MISPNVLMISPLYSWYPIHGKKCSELKGSALQRLRDDLQGISYLIIDEYSVIGQKLFGWINRRCKQATVSTALPFRGISVILVGDIAQLPPITDKVIYHNKPTGDLATDGFYAYHQFQKVIKLPSMKGLKDQTTTKRTFESCK